MATNAHTLPESLYSSLEDAARLGFTEGIGSTFAIAAATCLFCAALVWFGIKEGQAPARQNATLVGS